MNQAPNSASAKIAVEGAAQPKATSVVRPPTGLEKGSDWLFRRLTYVFAAFSVLILAYILYEIGGKAIPAIGERGLGFITGTTWNPNTDEFSILPEIWGTLYTSLLALLLGTIFGVAVAIFLSEGFLGAIVFEVLKRFKVEFHPVWGKLPTQMEGVVKNIVELLAAIPSVVYGLWGLYVVIPMIRPVCTWLNENMGWFPLFSTRLSGPGILPASLVLAIMILPTIAAISREALIAVPPKLREASYGLGAMRWETIFAVILPTSAAGIFGGVILGFGRALGETMALAMLVGNANTMTVSLFSPANTLAALLANNFPEAGPKQVPVLMYAALVLLLITLVVNVFGSMLLKRTTKSLKGAH